MADTIIHTLFVDGGELPEQLPVGIARNIESWRDVYPHARQIVFSLNEARAYLHQHFDRETCNAFDTLKPYAFKSDLFRYCFLYHQGGLYADISLRALRPLPLLNAMALFKTTTEITPWSLCQGLIYAQAGREELQLTIDCIKQNVRDHNYGCSNLDVTGPSVLGQAVAQCGTSIDYAVGEMRAVTPGTNGGNNVFLMNYELFAVQVKIQAGDIAHLGLGGTNNYIEMWRNGVVFGEDRLRQWMFPRGLALEGASYAAGIMRFVPEAVGVQTRGPWIAVEAGNYRLRLRFGPDGVSGRLGVAITVDGGRRIVQHLQFDNPQLTENSLELDFGFAQSATDAEFITLNPQGNLRGSLLSIELEKVSVDQVDTEYST